MSSEAISSWIGLSLTLQRKLCRPTQGSVIPVLTLNTAVFTLSLGLTLFTPSCFEHRFIEVWPTCNSNFHSWQNRKSFKRLDMLKYCTSTASSDHRVWQPNASRRIVVMLPLYIYIEACHWVSFYMYSRYVVHASQPILRNLPQVKVHWHVLPLTLWTKDYNGSLCTVAQRLHNRQWFVEMQGLPCKIKTTVN